MSARTGRPYVVMAVLAIATVLVGGAACGGDDTGDLPPPASPPPDGAGDQSPGLDLSPAEQQAVDEARAHFDVFMNAYIDVSTAEIPTADDAEALFALVDQHTGGGDLPADLRAEIVGRWGSGNTIAGTLGWDFIEVLGTDLDRVVQGESTPEVALRYCIDATDWVTVDASTGESVSEPDDRQVWMITAYWHDDWSGLGRGPEGWRIGEREVQDKPC